MLFVYIKCSNDIGNQELSGDKLCQKFQTIFSKFLL